MRTVNEWIRRHLDFVNEVTPTFTMEQLEQHVEERLGRPLRLIFSRVAVGFLRYDLTRGRSPRYLGYLEASLARYKETKNSDALLDVAFYAMAEFQDPSFEGTFYEPSKNPVERVEL